MENGVGGIVWIELTSIADNPEPSPRSDDFLAYMQQPETSYLMPMADSTRDPIANMADPDVFKKFSKPDLAAIQYGDLAEDPRYREDHNDNPDYLKMMQFCRGPRPPAEARPDQASGMVERALERGVGEPGWNRLRANPRPWG